jgi:hypothetical protein
MAMHQCANSVARGSLQHLVVFHTHCATFTPC